MNSEGYLHFDGKGENRQAHITSTIERLDPIKCFSGHINFKQSPKVALRDLSTP